MTDTGDKHWDGLTRREKVIWIAAFLEGEGCFTVPSGTTSSPTVGASQTREEPIARIISVFGGRWHLQKRSTQQTKDGCARRDMYAWWCHGEKAIAVCRELLPFLSPPKRIQARTLIAYRYNCPALKRSERGRGMSVGQKNLRVWYTQQMKLLKQDPFRDAA